MPKATVQDILDLGFQATHFGADDKFSIENKDGYLYKILTDVGIEVRQAVGAALYDAASAAGTQDQQYQFSMLKRAEQSLCAAELFSRRIIFLENSAMRQADNFDALMAELRRNAQRYEDSAWRDVAQITGAQQNGSFSSGIVESGAYPAAT